MSDLRVLITCPQMQRTARPHVERLERLGIRVELPEVEQQLSEADLLPMIARFDGMIAGDDVVSAAVLKAAPRLRVVAKWGVGMDNIDRSAAASLGIRVVNTPDVFAEEVADVALGYLILLARGLHLIDRAVREGTWRKIEGVTLAGRTLGIVGLGSIGRATARRGIAVGMTVLGADPLEASRDEAARLGVEVVELDDLVAASDAISLHCPLTDATWHMMDAARLARMQPGSWIINTARGHVIDEAALIATLRAGRLAAAALDVYETEPLPADSPLRKMDQVILGSHNASNTRQAVERVNVLATENLLRGLEEVRR